MPNSPLGRPAKEIAADVQARMDQRPARAGCIFCPGWKHEGPASECRQASAEHRAQYHAELKPTRVRHATIRRHRVAPEEGWREEGLARGAEIARMLAAREAAA